MTKLTENQIKDSLYSLPSWDYKENEIAKTYALKDFPTVIRAVNQIAAIANNYKHHPDMDIRFNKVTFRLTTHGEGGVTEKDITLAKDIEKIVVSLI